MNRLLMRFSGGLESGAVCEPDRAGNTVNSRLVMETSVTVELEVECSSVQEAEEDSADYLVFNLTFAAALASTITSATSTPIAPVILRSVSNPGIRICRST